MLCFMKQGSSQVLPERLKVRDSRVKGHSPLHNMFADLCGSGEPQLTDLRMVGQSLAYQCTWRRKGLIGFKSALKQTDHKAPWEVVAVCVSVEIPDPGRMLTTPLGKPTLAVSSANFSAVNGVTWRKGMSSSACGSLKYSLSYIISTDRRVF